ncbi:MAG TPA: hypothetical protein VF818_12365 [Ktedonobacterales bacterium]
MPDRNDEHQAERRHLREREYEIDRITAEYAEEWRAGRSPRVEDYIGRYPDYATEISEFAVYFHTIAFDLPEPDAVPAAQLSPAARNVLAQIQPPPPPAIAGLVKQGTVVGFSPRKLAEAVRLTTDLLGKLEARAIDVATIPPTLIRRLAETLKVAPEAVAAYLGASGPAQAGAFFYADQAPTQRQESFLDAVQRSTLAPEVKREWDEIVNRDREGGV